MVRQNPPRRRFWAESALAALSAVLAVVTLFAKDWIEVVFGVDPDHGEGSLEWLVVAGLTLVAAALTIVARAEWRRPATI